jgi:putative ABC transport system permease protein
VTAADLVRFASRALLGHRLRTLLSLLGVAIGVAAVMVLTALTDGARTYVVDQFASLGSNLVIVLPGRIDTTGLPVPGAGGVPHDLTLEDAEVLARSVRTALRVAPFAAGTETVSYGDRSRQVGLLGATSEYRLARRVEVAAGEFLPAGDWQRGAPVAVLGSELARELFPGERPVGKIVRVGAWRMRVVGVLAPQGTKLGVNFDETVMVPVATAMKMLDASSLFRVFVEVRAHADVEAARRDIRRQLAERHREEDFTVITQDAMLATFGAILAVLTLALIAIASISLTVAGIGIMNVMLVSVSERTREIGLLRALGGGRRQVLAVFLGEAAMLSTAGGVVGLGLGWLLVRLLVQLFPALPAAAPAWSIASALAVAVGVGLVFGILPARRAAHLDPVAALAGG